MRKYILFFAAFLACMQVCAQSYVFQKVTSEPADWSGEYLIVKEVDSLSQAIVFNGALTTTLNKKNNCFVVSVSNDQIASATATDAATFTFAKQADGTYTIRSASGYYIGTEQADSAAMSTKKNTPLYCTVAFESDTTTKVRIKANMTDGYVLRYNAETESNRFRFYSEGKKKSIHLYKKVSSTALPESENESSVLIDGRLYFLPEGIYIKDGKLVYIR